MASALDQSLMPLLSLDHSKIDRHDTQDEIREANISTT